MSCKRTRVSLGDFFGALTLSHLWNYRCAVLFLTMQDLKMQSWKWFFLALRARLVDLFEMKACRWRSYLWIWCLISAILDFCPCNKGVALIYCVWSVIALKKKNLKPFTHICCSTFLWTRFTFNGLLHDILREIKRHGINTGNSVRWYLKMWAPHSMCTTNNQGHFSTWC